MIDCMTVSSDPSCVCSLGPFSNSTMGVAMKPRLKFCGPNERLDHVSLELIKSKHPLLWKQVLTAYPSLEMVDNLDKVLLGVYQDMGFEINHILEQYAEWWKSVEASWMCYMMKLFEEPKFDKEFKAHVTISSLYVRELDSESFLVPLYAEKSRVLEVCAHEICHFFFYRRLQEIVYVEVSIINSSRKIWMISEALVPLIFNTQKSKQILGACSQSTYACSDDLLDRLRTVFSKWEQRTVSMHKMIFEMLQIINEYNESTGGTQCSI